MEVQSHARNQARAESPARRQIRAAGQTRNRAQASRQRRAQTITRGQARTARRSSAFRQFTSRKLEALIFVAVLAVAIGGMYFAYYGTGQAVRRLPACVGGYVIPHLSFTGLSPNYLAEYKFRGIQGSVELIDIQDQKARFKVDGVMTDYIGLTEVWLGEQVGIKVGDISRNSVGICLASTVPECVDYYWDLDTRQKECGKWQSQADYIF
ncbi:hypothetical protein JW851_02740 [Candidatus Woesearchaeota archaeon]|nr:hypothetical protein [Candidatus Woesearchaeota archaeon]